MQSNLSRYDECPSVDKVCEEDFRDQDDQDDESLDGSDEDREDEVTQDEIKYFEWATVS